MLRKIIHHNFANESAMPQSQPPIAAEASLVSKDQQYLWHPYSSMIDPPPLFAVTHAEGVNLHLADGRKVIDGMSSWWCTVHGYNHPALNSAAKGQIDKMSHVMFGGLTHQPAVDLGEKLVKLTPPGLDKVFLCDSGSISVEVAIKMALQFWLSQGIEGKHRLLTVRNGYHGDTFAAMSVCDPVNGMHHLFSAVLQQQLFAPAPVSSFGGPLLEGDCDELEKLLAAHHSEIAAMIIEPIVQGAGGMRFYSAEYLRRARELCTQYDVLLIADEIATGFGRSGKLFACEWAGISPDILCLGKALTGGYMTMAATLCSERVALGISNGEAGCFMHGPTFMGNPLAAATANASIDLLLSDDWEAKVTRIESELTNGLAPLKGHRGVADVRCLGAIGVVELKQPALLTEIQPLLVERGVWLRPFGKLLYTMPPFISSSEDIAAITDAMCEVVELIS